MKKTLIISLLTFTALSLRAEGPDVADSTKLGVSAYRKIIDRSSIMFREAQMNGYFSHLDLGVTLSNVGIGFDFATPLKRWGQLRIGGTFRPNTTYDCSLGLEISEGLTEEQQQQRYDKVAKLASAYTNVPPTRTIDMSGGYEMLNFKMLVDFYPIRQHRNLRITAGFYWGNGTIVKGTNTAMSGTMLSGVTIYNAMYRRAAAGLDIDLSAAGFSLGSMQPKIREKLQEWGAITIPVGTYANDMVAEQSVYYSTDVIDAQGNVTHSAGELMYAQGDVIHRAGETIRLTPDDNDVVRIDAKVNKFKPYLGIGYTMPVTKDGRTQISLDAGLLIWGGAPSVVALVETGGSDKAGNRLFQSIDLAHNAKDVRGKLGTLVDKAKGYTVMPELSLRFSQRIW